MSRPAALRQYYGTENEIGESDIVYKGTYGYTGKCNPLGAVSNKYAIKLFD